MLQLKVRAQNQDRLNNKDMSKERAIDRETE